MSYVQVLVLLVLTALHHGSTTEPEIETEESRARDFLQSLNNKTQENNHKLAVAIWEYSTNMSNATLQHQLAVQAEVGKQQKENWLEVIKFNWQTFSDADLKRQFKKHSKLGPFALPEDKLNRFNKIIGEMEKIYTEAKICDFNNPSKCDLALQPDLLKILASSRDPDELKHVWVEWRNAVGPHCKGLYEEYVVLSNEAAKSNNYTNNAECWLDEYEDPQIRQQIQLLWEQLKPLYSQIHAYVRYHLRQKYGDAVSEIGPIPAHLLGEMWSASWRNIADFTLPYPNKVKEDLTEELRQQNYTAEKIFRTAEDFFKSINLTEMPQLFWQRSILQKPEDREMLCQPASWNFYDQEDFRITQCSEITFEDFISAHHEMGHVEYYLQYMNQPLPYQFDANNGFGEAIGDSIALSVESRKHLRKIGLLKTQNDDPESVLNSMFSIALDKIVFLPYAYLMELWRWDVFEGKTTPDNYNCRWWKLREEYQGIEPPVNRTEQDFDPAAKYHIVGNIPYIRYFVSFVIQFQFHKALCKIAGEYDPNDPSKPLHECDIYQNTDAGNALKEMMQLGASKPWPDALEVLTGQRTMDASAILEYFKPLQEWLEKENKKNCVYVGWDKSDKVCTGIQTEETPE